MSFLVLIDNLTQGRGMASELASRLRDESEKRGSIRSLARAIGVSDSTIHRIFKGERVDTETLDRIAAYLYLPKEEIYRMAELLPPGTDNDRLTDLAMYLFQQLPEDRKQRLLAQLELEVKLWEQENQT